MNLTFRNFTEKKVLCWTWTKMELERLSYISKIHFLIWNATWNLKLLITDLHGEIVLQNEMWRRAGGVNLWLNCQFSKSLYYNVGNNFVSVWAGNTVFQKCFSSETPVIYSKDRIKRMPAKASLCLNSPNMQYYFPNLWLMQMFFYLRDVSLIQRSLTLNKTNICDPKREYGSVCSCHVTYALQNESTLCSCLNVKEPIAHIRREIWNLNDCNWIRTQNHLVRKRTLNDLAKLAWLSVRLRTKWFWVRVQLKSLRVWILQFLKYETKTFLVL